MAPGREPAGKLFLTQFTGNFRCRVPGYEFAKLSENADFGPGCFLLFFTLSILRRIDAASHLFHRLPDTADGMAVFEKFETMTTTTRENRLFYIDNLRIFCIALVVLHHLSITYGASGDWMYVEGKPDSLLAQVSLILFTATNQAFFMGLLFFVSTLFITTSYNRKGPGMFLRDRLIRLGIPTLAYYFLLGPFTAYIGYWFTSEDTDLLSFGHFLNEGWGRGFGPMWFVETLILFTFVYVLFRILKKSGLKRSEVAESMPEIWKIAVFVICLGLCTGIVRTWYPVDRWLPHLHLQLAHFPQYIAMMIAGVVAWQRGWLDSLSLRQGIGWFGFANLFILIFFPLLFIGGGAASGVQEPFMGGWHWQNFGYSLYEQIVGISLMLGLLGLFRGLFNGQGKLIKAMSDSTYTVYIIHAIPILIVSWSFRDWQFPLLAKFAVLSLPTLMVSFLLGWLIRKLPLASKVI